MNKRKKLRNFLSEMFCEICNFTYSGVYCPKCGEKGTFKQLSSTLTKTRPTSKFCVECASPVNGSFCAICGHKVKMPLTFEEFKSSFPKKPISKRKKNDQRTVTNTCISIKEMLLKEDGSLNTRGGNSIPLQISVDAGPNEVHLAAHEKMTQYSQTFNCPFELSKLV